MLQPEDRTLLVDLLSAPEDYHLDAAIGTTFTLDLTALLPIPLAFAGADLSSGADPLTVLQAIRTYADRIDVFCQVGSITLPPKPNYLLGFLESVVHQVDRPAPGRLFHPKLWVLRFAGDDDPEDRRFRVLCGSRNLTHDRAWDAIITLDGAPVGRQRRAVNNPLVDFLSGLPERVPGFDPVRRERILDLAESLRSVEWEPPADVVRADAWLQFHTFGRVRSKTPDLNGSRCLVVSPFINDEGLESLFQYDTELTILSRAEELDRLDERSRKWFQECATRLFVLNDDAAIPALDEEEAGSRWSLSGLHAKIYVAEQGQRAHVFIGSANATDAAWNGNDEFLVELVGKRAAFGVNSMTETGFGSLLVPHKLGEMLPLDPKEELRRKLENALRDLVAQQFTALLTGSDGEGWLESVSTEEGLAWHVPKSKLVVGLVTTPEDPRAVVGGKPLSESWPLGELEDATPFVTLRLSVGSVEASTVVLARLVGDQSDRLDRVLARQFRDEGTFLRFLMLLLQLAGDSAPFTSLLTFDPSAVNQGAWATSGRGLLESLMNALATAPSAIDDVGRLVDRLKSTEEGRKVLPAGWDELWSAVVEARARVGVV